MLIKLHLKLSKRPQNDLKMGNPTPCMLSVPTALSRPPEVDFVPGIQMLKPKCACPKNLAF